MIALPLAINEPAGVQDDILVLGRRTEKAIVTFKRDEDGRILSCDILQTSGDPELDQIWCTALDRCAAAKPPTVAKLKNCAKTLRRNLVAELSAKRRKTR